MYQKNSFKNKEHNKKTSVEKYNADFLKQVIKIFCWLMSCFNFNVIFLFFISFNKQIAFLPQKKKGRPRKIKDVDLQNNSKNNPVISLFLIFVLMLHL